MTFGSQSAFLASIGALDEVRPTLPWLNVWSRNDFVSFLAGGLWPGQVDRPRSSVLGVGFPESHGAYAGEPAFFQAYHGPPGVPGRAAVTPACGPRPRPGRLPPPSALRSPKALPQGGPAMTRHPEPCSIIPPFVLARVAREGTADQRAAALSALESLPRSGPADRSSARSWPPAPRPRRR